MIARELTEFFAASRPTGRPGRAARRRPELPVQRQRLLRTRLLGGDPLPRRRLRRGPGLRRATCSRPAGARSITPAPPCCTPTTTAPLSSCAATSTSTAACARRPATSSRSRSVRPAGYVRRAVASDRRWMAEHGVSGAEQARWSARSAVHHGGRRVFSALGSRAERVPAPLRGALSLERRDDGVAGAERPAVEEGAETASPVPPSRHVSRKLPDEVYHVAARVWADGPAPLLDPVPGMAERERLRLAMVIPTFTRGSGGHNTLFQIFTRLERRGHACSVWLVDYYGYARVCLAGGSAPGNPRVLRAVRGTGLQGLRPVAGSRRGDRDRLADRPCDARARPVPCASLRRQRPRAGVLSRLGRAHAERRNLPPTGCTASPRAPGCATAGRALRRDRRGLPARRRARRSTNPGPSSAAATPSSTTPGTPRRVAAYRSA